MSQLNPTITPAADSAAHAASICPQCRYSRHGLAANARCPECGSPAPPPDETVILSPAVRRRMDRALRTVLVWTSALALVVALMFTRGRPGPTMATILMVSFFVALLALQRAWWSFATLRDVPRGRAWSRLRRFRILTGVIIAALALSCVWLFSLPLRGISTDSRSGMTAALSINVILVHAALLAVVRLPFAWQAIESVAQSLGAGHVVRRPRLEAYVVPITATVIALLLICIAARVELLMLGALVVAGLALHGMTIWLIISLRRSLRMVREVSVASTASSESPAEPRTE